MRWKEIPQIIIIIKDRNNIYKSYFINDHFQHKCLFTEVEETILFIIKIGNWKHNPPFLTPHFLLKPPAQRMLKKEKKGKAM